VYKFARYSEYQHLSLHADLLARHKSHNADFSARHIRRNADSLARPLSYNAYPLTHSHTYALIIRNKLRIFRFGVQWRSV